MDHYFRRTDGQVVRRSRAQVDGKPVATPPPAPPGSVEISEAEGLAFFAAADAELDRIRQAERAAAAEVRRGVYDEAVMLGFSSMAASAMSGHRAA